MDRISPEIRSVNMRRIRSTGMKPEMAVRRAVHGLGYRYRLHVNDLPGRPDLVFRSRKKIIFVHGCFWHQHPGCSAAHIPASNVQYWSAKFARTIARDSTNLRELCANGWEVLVIWECEIKDIATVQATVRRFLTERAGG
jgi:DNA mismatch endonuclease (patch repair protein)